jgi:hypothetical protein
MIADAIELSRLVREVYKDRKIVSALFGWDGSRIEGIPDSR